MSRIRTHRVPHVSHVSLGGGTECVEHDTFKNGEHDTFKNGTSDIRVGLVPYITCDAPTYSCLLSPQVQAENGGGQILNSSEFNRLRFKKTRRRPKTKSWTPRGLTHRDWQQHPHPLSQKLDIRNYNRYECGNLQI